MAFMCNVQTDKIQTGVDGCSVPTFYSSLEETALAYARLFDADHLESIPSELSASCTATAGAMQSYPEMVAGEGRFDTGLMRTGRQRFLSKGGAEAFQAIAVRRGVMGTGKPAAGIAIKIADGVGRGRVTGAVALEVMRQLGALNEEDLKALNNFGPSMVIRTRSGVEVGCGEPAFRLNFA